MTEQVTKENQESVETPEAAEPSYRSVTNKTWSNKGWHLARLDDGTRSYCGLAFADLAEFGPALQVNCARCKRNDGWPKAQMEAGVEPDRPVTIAQIAAAQDLTEVLAASLEARGVALPAEEEKKPTSPAAQAAVKRARRATSGRSRAVARAGK